MKDNRRKLRRRRKFVRNIKRTVRSILLMPGKIPPIDLRTVDFCMKLCETVGIVFVGTLIATLIGNSSVVSVINLIAGFVFAGLLLFIKLADIQDRLVRLEMADYIYIR